MQLESQGVKTQISGAAGPTSRFRAEMDAVGFDIFSNGLYSRKIEAVVRELSCNAYDSHIAAGKRHEPFDIQLPTQYEPVFTIRDYGTGLRFTKGGCEECRGTGQIADKPCNDCDGTGDYDAVIRLYCTYFASNKRKSNEFVGALGLGSKSPFAYTNKMKVSGEKEKGGFDIANTYEGTTYFYTAVVDETGFPSASLLSIMDTPAEPNGVKIKFPVASNDIWEFENTAKYVFEFFPVHPRFIGDKAVTIATPAYSVRSERWGMRSTAGTTQTNGLRAISGVVAYSINNIDVSRLSEAQKKLVEMPIDLFFNIGELSIAASRETLQLDPKTVNNILQRLDVVQEHLLEEVKKQIAACPTEWEARLKIHELTLQSGVGSLVNDAFSRGLLFGKYTGFSLMKPKVFVNELDYNTVTLIKFDRMENGRGRRKKASKTPLFSVVGNKRAKALADVANGVSNKEDFDVRLIVDSRMIFVINDLKGSADRYVHYMLQKDSTANFIDALLITSANKMIPRNMVGNEAVDMLDALGNPPSVKASVLKAKYDPLMKTDRDITKVRRERRVVRMLSFTPVTSYRSSSSSTGWKKQWKKGDDCSELSDPTLTKYYVLIDARTGEPVPGQGNPYFGLESVKLVNEIRELDLFPEIGAATPIFGIKVGSNLVSDPSFVPFFSFVKDRLSSYLTPAKGLEMSLSVNPFRSEWEFVLEYIAEHPHLLTIDSPARQFALLLDKAKKAIDSGTKARYAQVTAVARKFNIAIGAADFNPGWLKVMKHYPMLKICSRKGYGTGSIEEKTIMVDYLRFADEQGKRLVLSDVGVTTEDEETEFIDDEETVNA